MRVFPPTFSRIGFLPFIYEKVSEEKGGDSRRRRLKISGWASTTDTDMTNEIIEVGFFDESLPRFLRRGTMRWMHGYGDVQGHWLDVRPVENKGYFCEGELIHLGGAEDDRRFAMVEEGLVASLSVGFDLSPGFSENDCGHYDENGTWHWVRGGELQEISLCDIPANDAAVFTVSKALGISTRATATEWHIGTPHRLPTAPEDAEWAPAGVSETQIIQTILGSWQNNKEPDWDNAKKVNVVWLGEGNKIDDFKLKVGRRDPITNDGTLKLFWRMVASRMAILFGARGGVDIPDAARKPAYDELVRCYKRFDKEPPEFKGVWKLKSTTWHNDELDIVEEDEALEYLDRLQGAATWLRNKARHWRKECRAPSALVLNTAESTLSVLAELCDMSGSTISTNSNIIEPQTLEELLRLKE